MFIMNFDDDRAQESYMVVVLEPEQLGRMKQGDPVTIQPMSEGGRMPVIKYPAKFGLLVAYEEQAGECYRLIQSKDYAGLLRHIWRGYKFTEVDGKHIDPRQMGHS